MGINKLDRETLMKQINTKLGIDNYKNLYKICQKNIIFKK